MSEGTPLTSAASAPTGPSLLSTFHPRLEILPASQLALWPYLRALANLGFVLYGGTAIALRLGHRESVAFDFFSERPLDHRSLMASLPFAASATVLQEELNTLTLKVPLPEQPNSPVKVSWFGGLRMGRIEPPQMTEDGVLLSASTRDLLANKLKVIHERSEQKDYLDIHALLASGLDLADGLACASALFGKAFQPRVALQAITYFKDGNLRQLPARVQKALVQAATSVASLPAIPPTYSVLGVFP